MDAERLRLIAKAKVGIFLAVIEATYPAGYHPDRPPSYVLEEMYFRELVERYSLTDKIQDNNNNNDVAGET